MRNPTWIAVLSILLVTGCAGSGGLNVREVAVSVADSPSAIAALISIAASGTMPSFDERDDTILDCIDDRDNGGDLEEALGEEGLRCYCYYEVENSISLQVATYYRNPMLDRYYCANPEPDRDFPIP